MKFITFCLVITIFNILLVFGRNTNFVMRKEYNHNLGAPVIKALMARLINPSQDRHRLYGKCIGLVTSDRRTELERRKLWKQIAQFINRPRVVFRIYYVWKFLRNVKINISVINSRQVRSCGKYLRRMLKWQRQVSQRNYQNRIRNDIRNLFGATHHNTHKVIPKTNSMISHFIGNRMSPIVSGTFFKKLN